MNMETWKIIPTGVSGLHLGRHGTDQENSSVLFSSDSLFSALVASLGMAEGIEALETFIKPFDEQQPPLVISSAFPYAGDVRFYPTPLNALQPTQDKAGGESVRAKDLKNIQFVSEGALQALLDRSRSLADLLSREILLPKGFLLLSSELDRLPEKLREAKEPIYHNDERARVLVDRISNASNLFFTGYVHFAQSCGLWFGVRWLDTSTSAKETFVRMVTYLAENGIGGSRSSGYGQVEISDWDYVDSQEPVDREWLLLSRYIPREDETPALTWANASYRLEEVGGWLQSPGLKAERRKTVNMVKEGAVLGPLEKMPLGQVVDVQPVYGKNEKPIPHPVYRSGLAFGVGYSARSDG